MLLNGKKIQYLPKRGGQRKRKRQAKKSIVNPLELYKETKTQSTIFDKKLGQYRMIVWTDFNIEDSLALTILAAWIKTNEKYFDSRSNFPFYGFVVSQTDPENIKPQRIREYLSRLAGLLGWDDPEHHLYNGFVNAGVRIWTDGLSTDSPTGEHDLVQIPEMLDGEEYEPLSVGIKEIMDTKSSNLFMIYLRQPNFLDIINDQPQVLEYLLQVPGVFYGQNNLQRLFDQDPYTTMKFMNRTPDQAALIYVDDQLALGSKMYATEENYPKLFNNIEVYEADDFSSVLSNTIHCWNNYRAAKIIEQLSGVNGFENVNFNGYSHISTLISPELYAQYKNDVDQFDNINLYSNLCIGITSPLAIIAILCAMNTIEQPLFTFESCKITKDASVTKQVMASKLYTMCSKKPVTKYVSFGKLVNAALKVVE